MGHDPTNPNHTPSGPDLVPEQATPDDWDLRLYSTTPRHDRTNEPMTIDRYVIRYHQRGAERTGPDGRLRPVGLVYAVDISYVAVEPGDPLWSFTKTLDTATVWHDRAEAEDLARQMAYDWPDATVLDVAEAPAYLPVEPALPAGVEFDRDSGALTIPVRSTNNLPGRLTVYVTQYGDLALSAAGGDCGTDEPDEVIVTLGAGQPDQIAAMLVHVAEHGTHHPLAGRHHRVGVAWVCRHCGHGTTATNSVVEIDGHLAHQGCEDGDDL